MKILQILYYYTPYTSGLTIVAERLSRELVKRGHQVSVLCSWHDRSLPRTNVTSDGVHVIRTPIAVNVDRAVIMPGLLPNAIREIRRHDVVHFHLPMLEAAPLVALARLLGKKTIVTHHADLILTGSPVARLGARLGEWSGIGAGKLASHFVTSTRGRAAVSPTVTRLRSWDVIPPPVEILPPSSNARAAFRERYSLGDGPVIGYAGRYAIEKGLDVLLSTIPALQSRWPNVQFAFAGSFEDMRTGEPLRGPWDSHIAAHPGVVHKLGNLQGQELSDFYAAIDVLALPSINWTETFGMVQVEAMLCGTPCVVSDLPGVQEPVQVTGMGRVTRAGDADDLAAGLADVLEHREQYIRTPAEISEHYSLSSSVDAYLQLYQNSASPAAAPSGARS